MNNEEITSYFRQVVRDCVNDLKRLGYAYCFNEDQIKCIKEILPEVEVHVIDDMFKLTYSGNGKTTKGRRGRPKCKTE